MQFFTILKISLKRSWEGAWVVQLDECPTLGFGLGHNLKDPETEPHIWLHN